MSKRKHLFNLGLFILTLVMPNLLIGQNKILKEKSIFWEITPKNGGKSSYLYGTMHVSKKVAFHLPDKFYDAIKKSDIVALESNPEYWNEELEKSEELKDLFALTAVGINTSLNYMKPFYAYAYGQTPITNKIIKAQLSYEPHSANELLFRSYGLQKNFEEDTYLDLYIYKTGRKFGKEIQSLEDVVWSTKTVLKGSFSEENKKSKKPAYEGNLVSDMEDAYREQNLEKLDSIQMESAPSEAYLNGLLYIRNDTMFSSMEKQIKAGKSIFAAVGAAHLGGEKGMLLKFIQAGYTVKPIKDASILDPSSNINALDSVYLPVTYTKKYAEDSTLSFLVPAYTTRSTQTGKVEYLSTDMVNGVYYYIGRQNSFLQLSGLSTSRIMEKLDSLLFENTKGTILEKNKSTYQNYPCYNVTNKTKDGKIHKQKIIITPLEILFCKVVGKENYFKKYNADTFLNNIVINYPIHQKIDFLKDIEVSLPYSIADYPYSSISFNAPNILLQGLDAEGDYFQFVRNYSVRQLELEEDSFHVNMFAHFLGKEFKLKTIAQKPITRDKIPGVEVEYQTENGKKVIANILNRGSNVYFLLACTENKNKAIQYFNSFSIKQDTRKNVPLYEDTASQYSFKTFLKPMGGGLAKELFSQYQKQEGESGNKRKNVHTAVFQDNALGYQFTVNQVELNKYESYPSVDSFWNAFYAEGFDPIKNKFILNKKTFSKNNQHYMLVTVTDTNTNSISKNLYLTTGNKLMEVLVFADSSNINYHYIDTALNTIQFTNPSPTVLTQSKLDTFKVHLVSKDSTTKAYFNNNYYYLQLLSSDEKSFVKFVDTSESLKKKDEVYASMIYLLDNYKNSQTLDFVKRLYTQYEDNSDRQITLLILLAYMNDTASTLLFKKLITEAPPLSFEEDNDPLNHYYDTLSLTKLLLPDLMQLTDFDDYKYDVFYLLDNLLKEKKIDSSVYEQKVNYFTLKAKEEIKRRTSQKSSLQEENEKSEEDNEEDKKSNTWSSIGSDFTLIDEKESYNSKINFNDFYLIRTFANLLAPYKNRDNVKEFFKKIDSTNNQDLKFDFALLNAKDKKVFDKNIINEYAKLPKYRYKILHEFYFNDIIQQLPFKIEGQKEVAKSNIMETASLDEKDDLQFVTKVWVKSLKHQGYIYIFKHKKEKDKNYLYDFMGLFEKDEKMLLPKQSIVKCNIDIEKKTDQEFACQLQDQFRVIDRTYINPNQMIDKNDNVFGNYMELLNNFRED